MDWHSTIKKELIQADCAIIILTRTNIDAPWINFEAGGIAVSSKDERRTIPLLIDVDFADIKSPLKHYQSIVISKPGIKKLIEDVKALGNYSSPSHIQDSIDRLYFELASNLESITSNIEELYIHDNFNIFSQHIKGIKRGKVFVGVPMASADDTEYPCYKECALRVKEALINFAGAKEVYCPSKQP